jgi:DNA/RNA-binding domain of Phe-tRNA-synthetase-like protein
MEFAMISVEPHPLLDVHAFIASFARPLADLGTPAFTVEIEIPDEESLRAAVRDLLRHGGFKPSGRNKPASEYLARGDALPTINVAVDAGNAVSRASGLPVSVVDADLLVPPLSIAIAPTGTAYPFNPSGQVFDAGGLICLLDAHGVSATPVKDAQRTKTSASTTRTLCIVWGVAGHAVHGARVAAAYRALVAELGAAITEVPGRRPPA